MSAVPKIKTTFKMAIEAKKYHLDIPGTFIPNEIANPIVVFCKTLSYENKNDK